MKQIKWILIGVCVILVLGGLYMFFGANTSTHSIKNMQPGYVKYNTGDEIVFNETGNSADYIAGNIGWGKQEPKHRCIVGKNAELKLFVADADGSDMRLLFNAFGTRAVDEKCQYITVYANDTKITEWCAASRDIYTAIIPGTLITDGNLHIRFDIAKPFVGETDKRPLGAAVRAITLEKMRGNQTKKKLSLWLQNKLWGGRVQNTYVTDNNETEKSK